MTATIDIATLRLANQHISEPVLNNPHDVVKWLGAVQAQDFGGAKWALGLRTAKITNQEIEQAFTDGTILRAHVLRPTWHFVPAEDIRWMLALSAQRIHGINTPYYRQLELDRVVLKQCKTIFTKALRGDKALTRQELKSVFQRANINTEGLRLPYIIMHAELDGIICSGPRRGKQFTYALLDDRLSKTDTLQRDEALAELTQRYFLSHGPATLKDYQWWSGLSSANAAAGLGMVKTFLYSELIDGETYWFAHSSPPPRLISSKVFLIPNYDEYIIGYTNRSAVFDKAKAKMLDARGNPVFQNTIIMGGRIIGTWKRILKNDVVVVIPVFFSSLDTSVSKAVRSAVARYKSFLGLPAVLE